MRGTSPRPNCALSVVFELRVANIVTGFINLCWTVFRLGLVLAVGGAFAAGAYLYCYMDEEIRHEVQQRLASHYRGMGVHVGGARFEAERGIAVYEIGIAETLDANHAEGMLTIEQLYLAGRVRTNELLTGLPPVERIEIRGATLRASRSADGKWNVASLIPLPKFSEQSPSIAIEDATVLVTTSSTEGQTPCRVSDIDLTLTPHPATQTNADGTVYRLAGSIRGLPARELSFEGDYCPKTGRMEMTLNSVGLDITPELLASWPLMPIDALRQMQLTGIANITVRLSRVNTASPVVWSLSARLERGRIVHARLPEPLTDLGLTATATAEGLVLHDLKCRYGAGTVVLACKRAGWAANAPLALSARAVGLALDPRLQSHLPAPLVRAWQRFQPAGSIDAEVRTTFDGHAWHPTVTAHCRGISLTDAKWFSYPLEQVNGVVRYTAAGDNRPDQLTLDLLGVGGNRPVRVAADLAHVAPREAEGEAVAVGLAQAPPDVVQRPTTAGYRGVGGRFAAESPPAHPVGWVEVSGQDIPLHEQLVAALPDQGEALVRALRPQGAVDFSFRAEWKTRTQPRADRIQEIRLKDCSVQFDRFPYPLHHVHGLVTERNRQWQLHDIKARGSDDSTSVTCRGHSTPRGVGWLTDLMFDVSNAPIDDNLRLALPPTAQRAWDDLRPQGRVDFAARVIQESGQPKPLVEVAIRPRDRNLSLYPVRFPYRLEQLAGDAVYRDARLEIANLRGVHGNVAFSSAACTWQPTPDGGWRLVLDRLNADRLTPQHDRELVAALPGGLRSLVERLQPVGTFHVHNSSLTLTHAADGDELAAAWDVNLVSQQAAMPGALPIQSVSGGVRLTGRHDRQASYTIGELDLDSVVWQGVQFTNVRGPMWLDRGGCLLGEAVSQKHGQLTPRVTADVYDGSLTANAAIQFAAVPSYTVDVALGGASLSRFVSERMGGPKDLTGIVSGRLQLTGTGRSVQTLSGNGELHVVDAHIYELPPLVRLLKVLNNRTPSTTAFNRCDMQFAVQGEHIRFQTLNLLGDAVSLYGEGETSFDRELDLQFYTLIGPADLPIPLLKTLAGQVSQQGWQLKVVGRWDNPEVASEALPGVNEVLKRIQAGAATMAPTTAVRDAVAPPRR